MSAWHRSRTQDAASPHPDGARSDLELRSPWEGLKASAVAATLDHCQGHEPHQHQAVGLGLRDGGDVDIVDGHALKPEAGLIEVLVTPLRIEVPDIARLWAATASTRS